MKVQKKPVIGQKTIVIVAFFFQVFCGGQQRHVDVGVRCRALGQPDLLLPGWTQGHHRRLFLRKGQLRCRFTSANLHIYIYVFVGVVLCVHPSCACLLSCTQ